MMSAWKLAGRMTARIGLWPVGAAVLFFVLAERGFEMAALLIVISGVVALPMLRGVFDRYGFAPGLRSKAAIGAAGLSCAIVLLSSGGARSTDVEAETTSVEETQAADAGSAIAAEDGGENADFAPAPTEMASLSGCAAIDGDTLNCAGEHIRLLGIDAPEMPGHCAFGRQCVEGDPYAAQASLQAALMYGMTIERVGSDRYGRTLGMVYVGNQSLSCHQLALGQAAYISDWDDGARVASECMSAK